MQREIRYIFAFWVLALIGASCSSQDEHLALDDAERVIVSLSLTASNDNQLRADVAQPNIDRVICAIYDVDGNLLPEFGEELGNEHGQIVLENATFPLELDLVLIKNQEYRIALWAQSSECEAYNTDDLKRVEVDYAKMPTSGENAEAYSKSEVFTAVANGVRPIRLRRALARVNVLMTPDDFSQLKRESGDISTVAFRASFPWASFNVVDDVALESSDAEHSFALSAITAERSFANLGEDYPTPDDGYIILAAPCIFAPSLAAELPRVTLALSADGGSMVEKTMEAIPLQRNWATNVLLSAAEEQNSATQ